MGGTAIPAIAAELKRTATAVVARLAHHRMLIPKTHDGCGNSLSYRIHNQYRRRFTDLADEFDYGSIAHSIVPTLEPDKFKDWEWSTNGTITNCPASPKPMPPKHDDDAETALQYMLNAAHRANQPINPEKPMSTKVIIETKTFLNGNDIKTLDEEQLIAAVKQVEKEIDDLKAVRTPVKKINAKVKECEATLAKLVEILDAR